MYYNIIFTDIIVLSNSRFNFTSTPIMLNKDLKLSSNEKCTKMHKNNTVIKISIKNNNQQKSFTSCNVLQINKFKSANTNNTR